MYSIAESYKEFHYTNIILIYKSKILKNDESSIDEISNGDIIWVIENKLYPDDSYYLSLQNKYQDPLNPLIYNVICDFADGTKMNLILSGEVTIHEMITAISERKGCPLDVCRFAFNNKPLKPGDMRKIKDLFDFSSRNIYCWISDLKNKGVFLGKKIEARNIGIIVIGTLDPIKQLFASIGKFGGKILIGNLELNIESKNYLSFYGINEDFNYIYKEE